MPYQYAPMNYSSYSPYYSQQQPQAQSPSYNNGIVWVQGESGAKSYLVAPNNTMLLMDSETQRFFLKSADSSGIPLPLRVFEYKEVGVKNEISAPERYVTKEEFEQRIEEILKKKVEERTDA